MKVVLIEAGHDEKDPGAVSGSLVEFKLNSAVVRYAGAYLTENYECSVILDFLSKIGTNCKTAIDNKCAAFISVHHNAGKGDGCEIYHASGDRQANALAEFVISEFKAIGQNSRGVKTGTFGMLTTLKNKIPCILTEFAFVDNVTDRQIIDTDDELKAEGVAIAKGVANYLSLQFKQAPVVLKSIEEVAREVLKGLWGNGNDRINRLKAAGYDPFAVQAAVNKMIMANKPTTTPPIIPESPPEPVKPPDPEKPPEPVPQTPVIIPDTPPIEPQIPEIKPVESAIAKLLKAILSLFKK